MNLKRRSFLGQSLSLGTGLFLVNKFSAAKNVFVSTAGTGVKELVEQFAEREGIGVFSKSKDLETYSTDFGHLFSSVPEAVLQPRNISEVKKIISFLSKEKIPVAIRGKGHSQSGQSLAVTGGVVLDMTAMKNIIEFSDETVYCEAGCTWRQIVEQGKAKRLIPPVMPMYLDLSIGGTISAGGIGSSSFRYGVSASIVKELEVVVADGSVTKCSREENAEVFHSVLANNGFVGVICSARVELRKYKPHIVTHYLLYDDLKKWFHDQLFLASSNCEHLQGFFSHSVQGLKNGKPFRVWFYGLQVSFEFTDDKERKNSVTTVNQLKPYKHLGEEIVDTFQFSSRFDARFNAMRQSGAFVLPHPWMELLLPGDKLETLLPEILENLPFIIGDGHRLIFINSERLPHHFQIPRSSSIAVFAALPTGIPPAQLQDILPNLKTVHDLTLASGGKRYRSGWMGMMTASDWQQQYGGDFSKWKNEKRQLDPDNLFQSKLFAETLKDGK